jgi:hypothetical protein
LQIQSFKSVDTIHGHHSQEVPQACWQLLFPLSLNRTYLWLSILGEKIVEGLGHEVL